MQKLSSDVDNKYVKVVYRHALEVPDENHGNFCQAGEPIDIPLGYLPVFGVKVKVKLSLCLTKYHTMKKCG
jgi:hypothetical protein